MKKLILSLEGAQVLTKNQQKEICGGAKRDGGIPPPGLCDCYVCSIGNTPQGCNLTNIPPYVQICCVR